MPLCSGIARDAASVMTIEHLMAAFYGCGIDNVRVDLDGPEVPAMDGSAAPFLSLIDDAGVVEQAAPRRAVKILKSVSIEDEGRKVSLPPHDGFKVRFEIDFDTPLARKQRIEMPLSPACFRQEIAEARTFGFLEALIRRLVMWSIRDELNARDANLRVWCAPRNPPRPGV